MRFKINKNKVEHLKYPRFYIEIPYEIHEFIDVEPVMIDDIDVGTSLKMPKLLNEAVEFFKKKSQ